MTRTCFACQTRSLLHEIFEAAEDSGASAALRQYMDPAVQREERREREAVADELGALWPAIGMDQGTYARRLGTSRSRLNTYLNGHTVPRATVLVRARSLAESQLNSP
jgi:DNA-binding transcriptional regulator YiaG